MSADFKYQWLYSFYGFSSPVCVIGLCVRFDGFSSPVCIIGLRERERERERNQFCSPYITELRAP